MLTHEKFWPWGTLGQCHFDLGMHSTLQFKTKEVTSRWLRAALVRFTFRCSNLCIFRQRLPHLLRSILYLASTKTIEYQRNYDWKYAKYISRIMNRGGHVVSMRSLHNGEQMHFFFQRTLKVNFKWHFQHLKQLWTVSVIKISKKKNRLFL